MYNLLVSVIVPVYNAEKYIERCINSIIEQTYANWELILINDGSKDNSEKIITKIIKNNKNLKIYLITKKNNGPSAARNDGIKIAKGKYITFIDADDTINTNYLETLTNEIKHNLFIVSGYNKISQNSSLYISPKKPHKWDPFKFASTWGKLYEREFLINNNILFPEDYKSGEDLFFILKLLNITDKYISVNYAGYNYYENDSSLTKKMKYSNSQLHNYIEVFAKIIETCKDSIFIKKEYLSFFICKTFLYYLFLLKKAPYENLKQFYFYFNKEIVYKSPIKLFSFYWQKGENLSVNLLYNIFCFTRCIKCENLIIKLISSQ